MPRLWSALVALTALVVYLVQSPPVTGDKDSPEFTLVLATNGVSHPTGYPLYTMLGHVFVKLVHALGATWPYAANAWSAVGGALAMYFLHRLAVELLPREAQAGRRERFLLGLLPVALFAFNPIWTYETTLAEVNSWHVAWATGAALLFTRLVRGLTSEGAWTSARLYGSAAAWGFVCGLGGAHHATSLFVAAPLSLAILVVLARRRMLRVGVIPTVLLAAFVPLLSYGFILWRASHPAAMQWYGLTPGLDGLITHATARAYTGWLGGYAPSQVQQKLLLWYVYPFLALGMLAMLVNAARARGLGERALHWGLTISALIGIAYAFDYEVNDPSSYFLHPQVFGLAALTPLLGLGLTRGIAARRAALGASALIGLASLVLWVPWLRTGQQRVGLFEGFDRLIHEMWRSIPADSGFVFWSEDIHCKVINYQLLDGEKPGLSVQHALLLYRPEMRVAFQRRYGFDPTAGLTPNIPKDPRLAGPAIDQAIEAAEARVNALSPLPVFHFDPRVPTVRLLIKPGTKPEASPPAPTGAPAGPAP